MISGEDDAIVVRVIDQCRRWPLIDGLNVQMPSEQLMAKVAERILLPEFHMEYSAPRRRVPRAGEPVDGFLEP